MKHVAKADLVFKNGFLINIINDEVVELAGLANQCNDLHRMASLNQFVKENRTALETESKPVTYKIVNDPYTPKPITSNRSVSTPTMDEKKRIDEKIALEWVEKQTANEVNEALAELRFVAEWLQNESFVYSKATFGLRFASNPLELTEAQVIEIVETYFDPEMTKLRDRVQYEY